MVFCVVFCGVILWYYNVHWCILQLRKYGGNSSVDKIVHDNGGCDECFQCHVGLPGGKVLRYWIVPSCGWSPVAMAGISSSPTLPSVPVRKERNGQGLWLCCSAGSSLIKLQGLQGEILKWWNCAKNLQLFRWAVEDCWICRCNELREDSGDVDGMTGWDVVDPMK